MTNIKWTHIGLIALLSGCNWIGDADYAKELENVDEDGDGVTIAQGDCNDQLPNVYLGAVEVWYDGIDGDCLGDNDFDQDGDGFVPDIHQGKRTTSFQEVAPLPGGDCNDLDSGSYPGADDDWYDGVDSDCGGEADYDRDGDGFVPDEYANLETENLEEQPDLGAGDCNDEDASINPNEIDNWYDGVDSDCGGENDYDRDGDGVAYELIDINTDVGGLDRGDCNDQDPLIFPNQLEAWYDGIDADCQGDDDFDQDGDGYVPTQYVGERTEGINGTGNLPGGDCDDLNPDRYEGAMEIISDVNDYDCDLSVQCPSGDCSNDPELGGDSATVEESPWLLYQTDSNPQNLRITSNSNNVFVSSRAQAVTPTNPVNGTTRTYYTASYVASFDLSNMNTDPSEFFYWRGKTNSPDSNPYSDVQDVVANDTFFIGAIGQQKLNSNGQPLYRFLRISAKQLTQTFYFHLSSRTASAVSEMEDVSVFIDSNDVIHAVGCEADTGVFQYARLPITSLQMGASVSMDAELEIPNMFMNKCEVGEDANGNGIVWGYDGATITPYMFPLTGAEESITFTPGVPFVETHTDVFEWTRTDSTDSAIFVFAEPSGVYARIDGAEYHISTDPNPIHAYGTLSQSGELIVSVVDASGVGSILTGDPALFTTPTPVMNEFVLTTPLALTEIAPYTFMDTDGTEKVFLSFLGEDGSAGIPIYKMGFSILTR